MFLETITQKTERILEYVLYVFIALFPFVVYSGYLFYGTTTRAVNLVFVVEVLAVMVGIALLKKRTKFSFTWSPITIVLGLFFVTLILSSLQGVDFSTSFWSKATRMTGLFYFVHVGLLYLFFLMVFRAQGTLEKCIKVFLVSAGIFSVGALLSRDGLGLIFTGKPWNGFTIGNSTFAAMYLYTAFMLSLYYVATLAKESRPWWKYFIPIIFVINPYFMNRELWLGTSNILRDPFAIIGEAQASAYTALFSVVVLAIVWGISKIRSSQIRHGAMVTGLIVGIVFGGITICSFLFDGFAQDAYLKQASLARPLVWELSAQSISERPWLGWGIDNFDRAFEAHYNNKLLEEKNGAEAWFDRAHNIFIDQAVETGYVGVVMYLLVYGILIGSCIYVLVRAPQKKDRILGAIMGVYFIGHLMELQTAFDTTISYMPLVFMTAITAHLWYRVRNEITHTSSDKQVSNNVRYALGIALIGVFGALFVIGTVPIIRAQHANGALRPSGSSEKRLPYYDALFGSPVDPASFLWRTISDFQRGIAEKPIILEDPKKSAGLAQELAIFVQKSEAYLAKNPNDYRMHMTLANAYIYQRLFGVDALEKAHAVLDQAILLVPQGPQPYWMKSVAYLYQAKFALAKTWAQKGYELNPNIEQSKKIMNYINRSIQTFPEITLYNFWQI